MLAGSSIIGGLINRHKKKKLMEEIIEKQPNFPYDYVDAKSPGDTPAGRMILRERDNKILRKNYGLLHE
jgi:hypothetical protein